MTSSRTVTERGIDRWVLVNLTGAAAVLIAAVLLLVTDPGRAADRPEPGGAPGVVAAYLPTADGQPVTLGGLGLDAPGGGSIEVLAVVPVRSTANVEVVGLLGYVHPPWSTVRIPTIFAELGFPPELAASLEPVDPVGRTFQLEADDRLELLLGLARTSGDLGSVNGVTVTYRRDGGSREERYVDVAALLPSDRADPDATADTGEVLVDLGLVDADEN